MIRSLFYISVLIIPGFLYNAEGQDFFSQSAECPFSGTPSAMMSADLNNDGKKDIILAGESDSGQGLVSFFMNQGEGTFANTQNVTVDKKPTELQTGDIDNDGRIDILTVNSMSKTVSVILAQADQTYKIKDAIKFKEMPLSIGMGDFNKDKNPDFAVTIPSTKELIIYKGNGKGSFKQVGVKTFEAVPLYIRTGDYAGSGQSHIIVTHENLSAITLIAPNETGSKWEFKTANLDFLTRPNFAELGDIDGDGIEDAMILDDIKQTLRVIFGESSGLFLDKEFPVDIPTTPNAFILDDFNADDRIDLVILDQPCRRALIMANILTTADTKKTPGGARITIICDKDPAKPNTADVGILSSYSLVSMLLYNGEGDLVRKYFEFSSDLPEGQFTFDWSGTDENENPVPDGAYVFYLKLGSITMSRMVNK